MAPPLISGRRDRGGLKNFIRSGIEAVITGRSRKPLAFTGTWVRIPPTPPQTCNLNGLQVFSSLSSLRLPLWRGIEKACRRCSTAAMDTARLCNGNTSALDTNIDSSKLSRAAEIIQGHLRRSFCLLTGIFQSTLPMRGATEADTVSEFPDEISIHAPHAGSDLLTGIVAGIATKFQSTLPMRGATLWGLLLRERTL